MDQTPYKKRIKAWREDPVLFCREVIGVEPDEWQADALRAFGDPTKQRISLQACAGPGKTFALAVMGWNFLFCYAQTGHHPNGAATAINGDNLKNNLWKEFAVLYGRSPILQQYFSCNADKLFQKDNPGTWFLAARTWSKSANLEEQGRTLSGLHSKFILYLIDESGDINPAILRTAEQGLSNCAWGKIVQAGNPTSNSGILYLATSSQRSQWEVIRITADPEDPKRSPRISIDWARRQIELYGRDNPWVMAYILGQFPPSAINTLLGPDEVEAAMGRHIPLTGYNWSQKRLGVDVARFGDDRSVIFPRQGLAAFMPTIMRNERTTDIAARVALIKAEFKSEAEYVDDTGHWGHGVIDNLFAAGHKPIGVQFHGKPQDPRYKNTRAEMWFRMAEWVRGGGSLPKIPEMVEELTAPTYTFSNGKLMLEEKDQIKARIGRSPDLADALCLTFFMKDMPAKTADEVLNTQMIRRARVQEAEEYRPFD